MHFWFRQFFFYDLDQSVAVWNEFLTNGSDLPMPFRGFADYLTIYLLLIFTVHTRKLTKYQNQLNEIANPNQGMYISSVFGNGNLSTPVKLLLDSGAGISLMDYKNMDKFPNEIKLFVKPCNKKIRLCDALVVLSVQIGENGETDRVCIRQLY